jgi:hypothetical protein
MICFNRINKSVIDGMAERARHKMTSIDTDDLIESNLEMELLELEYGKTGIQGNIDA